jgi:hypothetical protein
VFPNKLDWNNPTIFDSINAINLDTFAEEKLEQSNNYNSKSVNFCWI